MVAALDDLNGIETLREQVACYTEFPQSADSTNPELNARVATNATVQANVDSALSFLHPALAQLPTTVLDTVVRERPQYAGYIRHLVATQAHVLSPELESTLATLAPALNTFRNIRRQALRQTWTSAPSPHTGTLTRSTL
ncbi:hypothetical protein FD19_GL000846 [Lacticaseibacillus thailandensis DSM 22698 = JCM 13996]|uniref:Uncharacterized protein n=1 Tax=Lacticaseibacillus thailandensis DSM 22698 = JCM 13996 TaxID=1423810 RepID=A0A0R2C6F7_9LACO|nr:hypothetical protein FD19_GL000846 [Lacticaseibacillus thailandensis DSM 22698 = JCM 13996]